MGYCVKFYNKIPSHITALSENRFKSCIKRTLCKQAYYKLDDYLNDKNVWQSAGPAPQYKTFHEEVLNTWTSLSESEKQLFHNKYNELKVEYYSEQLNDAELYMKRKNGQKRKHDEISSSMDLANAKYPPVLEETTSQVEQLDSIAPCTEDAQSITSKKISSDNETTVLKHAIFSTEPANTEQPTLLIEEATSQNEQSEPVPPGTADAESVRSDNIPSDETTDINACVNKAHAEHPVTNTMEVLSEPAPPPKSANELYFLINSNAKCRNRTEQRLWRDVPKLERRRYARAVAVIKREYIAKYTKYLESLSSRELFDYYNKNKFS